MHKQLLHNHQCCAAIIDPIVAASCTDIDKTVIPDGTATSALTKPWHTLTNPGKLTLQAWHVGRTFSVA